VLEIIKEVKNNFTSTLDKETIQAKSKAVGEYDNEKLKQENLIVFNQKITTADKDNLRGHRASLYGRCGFSGVLWLGRLRILFHQNGG
jgi:hypothetical protein